MLFYYTKIISTIIGLTILWFFETYWPLFKDRPFQLRLRHDVKNMMFGICNALLTTLIFASLLVFVTDWAKNAQFGLVYWFSIPKILQWPFVILVFDFWQYIWHVLNHKVFFLWRFHSMHHTDPWLDASSAFRFHPFEIIFSSILRIGIMPFIGMTVEQLIIYEVILLPIILFHHSNYYMPNKFDRLLRWLIVTPWMHWVHHSQYQPETDSNFSSVFSFWDRIFQTFRLRKEPNKIELGLESVSEYNRDHVLGMLAYPFRKKIRN